MNKTLIIDIDCIAREEKQQAPGGCPLSFRAGVFQYLARITNELDYAIALLKPATERDDIENEVKRFCGREGITFTEVISGADVITRLKHRPEETYKIVCSPSYPDAASFNADIIFLREENNADATSSSWEEIYKTLSSQPRIASVRRSTSETDISCFVNLDGSGQNEISTGLGFFDHMLQQIARHGNIDLTIKVKGDLHIDEHHTIEDVGLALGSTFSEALGNKKGIERYGFLLPMDDCLAQVAIDFGGRPWLVWDATFTREKISDMPTEMFYHFFKSFSDTARCNLNIKAEGDNEHHKIESIFKAFAKSIGLAVTKNNSNNIPSTKGIL